MPTASNGAVTDAGAPAQYHANERREMLEFVPRTARRVLDVGCGEGSFGALLKARGAEVWGVEPSAKAAARARERLDRVIEGGIEAAFDELPRRAFDCLVFNDVLEHLVDPYSVLGRAKGLLGAGGTIVCSIPNVRYYTNLWNLLAKKQWRYEDEGILDRTHLRFFTKQSIVDMFREQGFSIQRMQAINGFTSWKYRLLSAMSLGVLSDVFDLQYACVVGPADAEPRPPKEPAA